MMVGPMYLLYNGTWALWAGTGYGGRSWAAAPAAMPRTGMLLRWLPTTSASSTNQAEHNLAWGSK